MQFYRFPADPERKSKWVAAVNRKGWYPTEYTWICSEHFVSGVKSNNPLAPNYVKHVKSPEKHRLEAQTASFECRTAARKRRVEETEKSLIAEEQRKKRLREEKENRRVEEANAQRRSEEIAEQKRIEEQRRVEELEMQKKLEAQKREQEEAEQLRKQKELEEKIRLEEARLRKIIQDVEQKKCEDAQEIKQLQQSEQQLKRMCNELLVKCNKTTEELDKVKMSEIKLSTKIDTLSERVINQLTLEKW